MTDVLLPAGDALEAFYEEMGIGRAQEGKVLKSLCTAVLDVRTVHYRFIWYIVILHSSVENSIL